MIRFLGVIVIAGVVWVSTGFLYSGEETNPRVILDRAIKAHGGEANLAKYPAQTGKMTGTFYGLGEGIPYTGERSVQGITQAFFALEIKVNDMTFKMVRVVSGDKGWIKQNDEAATEMSKAELAEEKERLFASKLLSLVPLKDKSFELSLIGEAKVEEKPAIGIRITKKGHREISLYFDKKSGMLVKFDTNVKDFMAGEVEYLQSTFFQEYKEFKGVKMATKILIQKDGKRHVEAQVTDFQPLEKLDDSVFKQP